MDVFSSFLLVTLLSSSPTLAQSSPVCLPTHDATFTQTLSIAPEAEFSSPRRGIPRRRQGGGTR